MMITTTQEVVAGHPDAITLFAILLFALLLAPATVPGQVGISQAQGQNTRLCSGRNLTDDISSKGAVCLPSVKAHSFSHSMSLALPSKQNKSKILPKGTSGPHRPSKQSSFLDNIFFQTQTSTAIFIEGRSEKR